MALEHAQVEKWVKICHRQKPKQICSGTHRDPQQKQKQSQIRWCSNGNSYKKRFVSQNI